MKILIVSQYYWPENSRVTDIAESLQEKGNDVTVLTGLPNYPQGFIYYGYRHGENRIQERNNVKIIRAKLIERRHDSLHRILNYYSFPHYGSKIAKKLDDNFDVVFAIEESPIMLVKTAITYTKKFKKPLLMYGMDLWPESLLAGGISAKSLIYKHYKKVSSLIYSQCNKILVSTNEHIGYIKRLPYCENLDIEYLPQYADTIFEKSNFETIDNGVIDLMFAGNVGKAQSLDTIIKAAELIKDNPKYRFHIVGSGSELENAKRLSKELDTSNVMFYGNKPLEEMPDLYKLADIMLVTLEDKPYANMTIPGKVQSYMACGKPIIGAINGAANNLINTNRIGIAVPAEDYHSLAKVISSLSDSDILEFSKQSKSYYDEHFRKDLFFKKLTEELNKLTKLTTSRNVQ